MGDGEVEEEEAGGGGVAADAGETTDSCSGDRLMELVGARAAGGKREEERRGRPAAEGPVELIWLGLEPRAYAAKKWRWGWGWDENRKRGRDGARVLHERTCTHKSTSDACMQSEYTC